MAEVKIRVVYEGGQANQGLKELGMTTAQLKSHQEAVARSWAQSEEAARKAAQAAFLNSDAYRQLDNTLTQLRGRLDTTFTATKKLEEGQDTLNRAISTGMLSKQQYITLQSKLQNEFRETTTRAGLLGTAFQDINAAVNLVRSAFVLFAGGSVLGAVVKSLYDASQQMQILRIAMDASTGSAMAGANSMAFVRKISEDLGLEFTSTATAFQKFSAAVQGTALEGEKAQKVYTQFAGAGRVLGLSAADNRLMFIALEQMVSKGKVSMEELRQQLGERLPGAMRLAAEAFGVTQAEFNKMIASGLDSIEFVTKLGNRVEEVYGSKVPEASKTAQAELVKLNNEWFRFKVAVGDLIGILGASSGVFSNVTGFLRNLGSAASEETPALERLARVLAILAPGFVGRGFKALAEGSAAGREIQGEIGAFRAQEIAFANLTAVPDPLTIMGNIDPFAGLTSPQRVTKQVSEQMEAVQKVYEETQKEVKRLRDQAFKEQKEQAKALADVEEITAKDKVEANKFASDFIVKQNKKKNDELLRDWVDSQADQLAWSEYYAEQVTREQADAAAEVTDYWKNAEEARIASERRVTEALGRSAVSATEAFKGFARNTQTVLGEVLRGHVDVTSQLGRIWQGLWNSIIDEFARAMTHAILKPIMKPFETVFEETGQWVMKNVFTPLWDFIKGGFNELVSFLSGIEWSKAFSSLVSVVASGLSFLGEFFSADFFAATGLDIIVTKPTKIIAGERGPERVTITPVGEAGPVPSFGPEMTREGLPSARDLATMARIGGAIFTGHPLGAIVAVVAAHVREQRELARFAGLVDLTEIDAMLSGIDFGALAAAIESATAAPGGIDASDVAAAAAAMGGAGEAGESDSDSESTGGADAAGGGSDAGGAGGAFATGTDMLVSKPTRFKAGEVGTERVTISRPGDAHGRLRDDGSTFVFNGPVVFDEYTWRLFKRDLMRA